MCEIFGLRSNLQKKLCGQNFVCVLYNGRTLKYLLYRESSSIHVIYKATRLNKKVALLCRSTIGQTLQMFIFDIYHDLDSDNSACAKKGCYRTSAPVRLSQRDISQKSPLHDCDDIFPNFLKSSSFRMRSMLLNPGKRWSCKKIKYQNPFYFYP